MKLVSKLLLACVISLCCSTVFSLLDSLPIFHIVSPKMNQIVRGAFDVKIPKACVPDNAYITFYQDDKYLVSVEPRLEKGLLIYSLNTLDLNIPDGELRLKARLNIKHEDEDKLKHITFSRVYLNVDNYTSIERQIEKVGINLKNPKQNFNYSWQIRDNSGVFIFRNVRAEKEQSVWEMESGDLLNATSPVITLVKDALGGLVKAKPSPSLELDSSGILVNWLPEKVGCSHKNEVTIIPSAQWNETTARLGKSVTIPVEKFSALYIPKKLISSLVGGNVHMTLTPELCRWINGRRCVKINFQLAKNSVLSLSGYYYVDVDSGVVTEMESRLNVFGGPAVGDTKEESVQVSSDRLIRYVLQD